MQNDSDDVADDNVPDDHRIDNIEPDSDHVDDIMDDPDDVDKQSTQRLCYFKDIQTDLIRKSNFKEFLICARAWENKVKSSRYKLPSTLSSVSGDLDVYAMELYPSDADFSLAPCSIFGDGNCLLRCGSMALYGNQDSHVEIRVRVALEMAVYRDCYLDDTFLRLGSDVEKVHANLPFIYSSFLSHYDVKGNITEAHARRLYGYIFH